METLYQTKKYIKVSFFTKLYVFILNSIFLFSVIIISENIFDTKFLTYLIISLIGIFIINLLFILMTKNNKIATIIFTVLQGLSLVSLLLYTFSIWYESGADFFDFIFNPVSITDDNFYKDYIYYVYFSHIVKAYLAFFLLLASFFESIITTISFIKNIFLIKNIKKGQENLDEKKLTSKSQIKIVYILLVFEIIVLLIFRNVYYIDKFEEYNEVPEGFFKTINEDKDINSEKNIYNHLPKTSDPYETKTEQQKKQEELDEIRNILSKKEIFPEELLQEAEIKALNKKETEYINYNGGTLIIGYDSEEEKTEDFTKKDLIIHCYFENKCFGDLFFYKMLVYEIKNGDFSDYNEESNFFTDEEINTFWEKIYQKIQDKDNEKNKNIFWKKDELFFTKAEEINKNDNLSEKISYFDIIYLDRLEKIETGIDLVYIKLFLRKNLDVLNVFHNEEINEEHLKIGQEGNFFKQPTSIDSPVSIYSQTISYTRNIQARILYYLEIQEEEKALEIIKTNLNLANILLNGDSGLVTPLVGISIGGIQIDNLTYIIEKNKKISPEFKTELKEFLENKDFSFKMDNYMKGENLFCTSLADELGYTGTTLSNPDYLKKLCLYENYLFIKYNYGNEIEYREKMNNFYTKNLFKSNAIDKMLVNGAYSAYNGQIKKGEQFEQKIKFLIKKLEN